MTWESGNKIFSPKGNKLRQTKHHLHSLCPFIIWCSHTKKYIYKIGLEQIYSAHRILTWIFQETDVTLSSELYLLEWPSRIGSAIVDYFVKYTHNIYAGIYRFAPMTLYHVARSKSPQNLDWMKPTVQFKT